VEVSPRAARCGVPRGAVWDTSTDHISADFVYRRMRMSSYCRQFPAPLNQNISEQIVGAVRRSNGHDLGANAKTVPYVAEHTAMAASIRGDGPYREPRDDRGREHHDLHYGTRVGLHRRQGDLDQIMAFEVGSDAERVRLRREDGGAAAAVPGIYKLV